jgi:hypothetical protein
VGRQGALEGQGLLAHAAVLVVGARAGEVLGALHLWGGGKRQDRRGGGEVRVGLGVQKGNKDMYGVLCV